MTVGSPAPQQYRTPAKAPQVRLTVLQAVQRNLMLVAAPVVCLVVVAAAIAFARTPVYTSTAELNVGGINLTVQAIPGYPVAAANLAEAYSRSIDATGVLGRVSRSVGESPDFVSAHVAATPVQNTPLIRVDATGSSAAAAQRLADAAATALASYADDLNRSSPDAPGLLRQYIAASKRLRAAEAALGSANGAAAQDAAQTRVDTAKLQQQTAAVLYQQSQAGMANAGIVQKLAPASQATNDRGSLLQQLVAGAIVAGLLIGVGLAVMRANDLSRRRLAGR